VKIADHDFQTKVNHARRFVARGDRVKVSVMFRGREITHPELGRELLLRLANEIADVAHVESGPAQSGRFITMVLAPAGR
jgi:translation initiation factor IF-3